MYRYDELDARLVAERIAQFRSQVARRLEGSLTEEEFRPLRLMNGVYLQLHAYMLRVAIPYGVLSAAQMRRLADVAERYDRGYGHFTTRQNIQFNWPRLVDIPDMLESLAEVQMHAIQTSGNCIRNITCDPLAGVAPDEVEDPRPIAELLRQWSTLHPELSWLPRKFKIAVTGAAGDRAAVCFHDIGLRLKRGPGGESGCEVIAGGGQGRTPAIGVVLSPFVPCEELLAYVESVLRVYNLRGRRDNRHKARLKILVRELGADALRREVEADLAANGNPYRDLTIRELARLRRHFSPPRYGAGQEGAAPVQDPRALPDAPAPGFERWVRNNVLPHKAADHAAVIVTLKRTGGEPGDASSGQMRTLADLAERHSLGELRVTPEQNILLPHVPRSELATVHRELSEAGLGEGNRGLVTDIVSCPGLDYCSLATARSIPVAQRIAERFSDPRRQEDIGPLNIRISGCINACGHHHIGHIGILGLEKRGEEHYQVTLGGEPSREPAIGERAGRSFSRQDIVDAVERLVEHYLAVRAPGETFLETLRRKGAPEFRRALHGEARA